MVDNFSGSGGGGGSRSPTRTPNDLLSQDYVELILGLGAGPWKGLVAGTHGPLESLFLGETAVQSSDGTSNFADFQVAQFVGDVDDSPMERVLGGDSSNLNVGVTLAQNTPVVRTTSSALRKTSTFPGIDRLEVRLIFNQLVKQTDEGSFKHTANFRIEYKATNSGTWKYYENQSTSSVYGKTDGFVKDFLIPVLPLTNADYQVRVTKLSPDNGTLEIVNMGWESLQMVSLEKPAYPGLAKLHIYGRVSEQFSSLPEISGIYDGFLIWVPSNYNPETRTYNESVPWNGQLVKRYSNNPAWVLYFLIKSTEYGLARYYQNVSVILQEFYSAGKWCDEQVSDAVVGQTQPRFTFNELIDSQKSGIELLYYIAGSFNSIIYDSNNGVIRLKTDQIGTAKQLFTPETVEDGNFNYSFSDIATRYNDITVQYTNPDLNWELDERSASIDASDWIEANGRIPLSFVAVGCTNTHEAVRRANDRLLTCNTEVTTVSFKTTRFGMLAELYDTILVADPISGWSTGGRVKSYASGVIQLRDPVFVTVVEQVTMKVQTFTGIVEIGVTPPSTGLVYSLNVTTGTFPTNVPGRVQFTVEGTTSFGFAKPFRVIAVAEVDGNLESFQITAVEINPNKYTDSASGTVSEAIQYSYVQPQEPTLPDSITVENTLPITLTGGTLGYRIRVTWTRPPNAFTDHYEIDFTEAESGTSKTQIAYGEEIYLEPVKDNTYYSIKFFAVSPTGVRSRFSITPAPFLVTTKSILLESMSTAVGDFLLVKTPNGWRAGWTPPTVPLKDFAGVLLKYTYTIPRPPWSTLSTFGFSRPEENFKDLGWFPSGPLRVYAKFTNTSGNQSANPVYVDLSVLNPDQPTAVITPTGASNQVVLTNPTTTQPLKVIEIKLGEIGDTWTTATLDYFTLSGDSLSFFVASREDDQTLLLIRATDVAGNKSSVATFVIDEATEGSGTNSGTATLYRWSVGTPSTPSGASTYTWDTAVNSAYTGSDGWYTTVPANPGTPLAKLWVAAKPITATFGVTTSTVDYTGVTPVVYSMNGSNGNSGTSGLQGANPTVYRWDTSTPTGPIGSSSYTWSSGAFGSAPSGWNLTPGTSPSPGYTLYAASVALIETAGVTSTNFNWSAASISARGAAGASGVNAKSLSLAASSQVFQVNNSGTSNPSNITFNATSQNLAGSPTFIATGGTLTGSGSTRTLTFANASSNLISVQVSQDGLIDVISVVKVYDGTDTYSVILSNETHNLPAGPTGGATSYAGAETYLTILKGPNDDTANWSVTYSDNNLNSIRSATSGGAANAAGRFWRITNQTADTGTVSLTLSKSGVPTLYAVFSVNLTRAGAVGGAGAAAKGLSLSTTAQVFQVNKDGTPNPSSITFTATSQNLAGSPSFSVTGGTLTGSGATRTLTFANATSDLVSVGVTQDGLSDTVSIVKVYDGSDTYNVILSNETQVLPADVTGGATSYVGAETYLTILKGSVDDTADWSIAYSDNNLNSIRSLTSGGGASASGRYWQVTSQSADNGYILFALTKSGASTLYAKFTCVLARKGSSGAVGNSYRTAYAVITGVTLSSSPSNYTTNGGSSIFPPSNTWGGGETWQATVPSYSAGQSIQQVDGILNNATGDTVWSSPYLAAFKVGTLSAITVNTGALNLTGNLTLSSGALLAGSYSGYSWPTTGTGVYLGPIGLLMGNYNTGGFVEIASNGTYLDIGKVGGPRLTWNAASGGSLILSNASLNAANGTFSGSLSAATGTFAGTLSAANGSFTGALYGGTQIGSGGYTSTYAWPSSSTATGFHLSGSGLLLGNVATGKYFNVGATGDVASPQFNITSGVATFSGSLSAVTGTFGSVTANSTISIGAGGMINSGSYSGYIWPSSGTGFHLGPIGLLMGNYNTGGFVEIASNGTYLDIGKVGGPRLTWNAASGGSLRVSSGVIENSTINGATLDSFSVSISSGNVNVSGLSNGQVNYGTRTASASGGKGTISYSWRVRSFSSGVSGGNVNLRISSTSSATVSIDGTATNNSVEGDLEVTATDQNQRTAVAVISIHGGHGTQP